MKRMQRICSKIEDIKSFQETIYLQKVLIFLMKQAIVLGTKLLTEYQRQRESFSYWKD
jgi:hypothetical protein